jgi:hypothetical protein
VQARKNLIEHSFSVTFNLRLLVLNFTRAERAACLMDLLKGSQIKINPSPDCPPSMCTQFAQIIKQAMGSYIVQTQEDEVRKILDRAISDASLSQIYKLIHMCKVFKQQTQTRLKDKALRTKAAEEWSKMILQLEARKETLLDQASMLSAGFLVKVLGMFLLLLSSLVLSDPYKWTISLNFIEPSLVLGVFLIGASLALVVNRYKKFNNNQIYSMAPYLKEAEKLFAESICKKLSAVGNHMLDEIKKDEKAKDFRLDTKCIP